MTISAKLKKTVDAISTLAENEQDELAAIITMEMEAEKKWSALFSNNSGKLSALAREALSEYRIGAAKPFNPESL